MLDALFSALSGLGVSSRKIQTSANNLANVQTSGFKASRADVADTKTGGATVTSVSRSSAQGSILTTSNPMDLAVGGNGFFQVALPNGGTGFTRAGNFKLDGAGRLVTSDGNPLIPEIAVPAGATEIAIGETGQVNAQVAGGIVNLGQIQLANFANPAGLSAAGGNVLLETAASGAPLAGNPGTGEFGTLISGAVEGSNVDIAGEIVDQIVAKAAFKANISVIKTADEMTGSILDIKA
ncbi:MAG: flagellar hook-basal body complex protein [Nitrospinae bacterium]|nr:flagellar hook-basal body complex protein [Nitrospinota bacterium]